MYIYKNGFTGKRFLQNINNDLVAKYLDDINSNCDELRKEPIISLAFSKFRMFDETGDRDVYQKDYYAHRKRMTMFMLRVWLFKEDDDIKELEDILWAICDEYTWALPAHVPELITNENKVPNQIDLFAADTGLAIAETLSICSELLHPGVVRRCINEVFKRIIEPFESGETEKYRLSWEYLGGNWSAVCGGSVGMMALYLIEDEKRLRKIIDRTKSACNKFIYYCADDGTCLEGATYWMFAMKYYVAYDELLRMRMGESIVDGEEKYKKLAEFPSVACLGNNTVIKFADCGYPRLNFGVLCKLNERYGVPLPAQSYYNSTMKNDECVCSAVRSIEWFDPELLHDFSRQDNIFLHSGQWGIFRSGNRTVVIKGGFNDEPHNHNDVGSYMYIKGKHILADDLGSGRYNKQYFDLETRYDFLTNGSHGHSLPVVNGYRQCYGKEYSSDKFEQTNDGVKISFAKAYDEKAELNELVRYLTVDEEFIEIRDSFKFIKKENSVIERIITELDASIIDDRHVSLKKGNETVGIIEALSKGKIKIKDDSYLIHRSSESSHENRVKHVSIIEIECFTDTDELEIDYRIS